MESSYKSWDADLSPEARVTKLHAAPRYLFIQPDNTGTKKEKTEIPIQQVHYDTEEFRIDFAPLKLVRNEAYVLMKKKITATSPSSTACVLPPPMPLVFMKEQDVVAAMLALGYRGYRGGVTHDVGL